MTGFDLKDRRIFVAGHRGMVGSALVRRLARENCEILTAGRDELDLRDQAGVRAWLADHRPDAVILAAAKVGGIMANSEFRGEFKSQFRDQFRGEFKDQFTDKFAGAKQT